MLAEPPSCVAVGRHVSRPLLPVLSAVKPLSHEAPGHIPHSPAEPWAKAFSTRGYTPTTNAAAHSRCLTLPPLLPYPRFSQVVAQAVINPRCIDVTLQDVGGLDHIIDVSGQPELAMFAGVAARTGGCWVGGLDDNHGCELCPAAARCMAHSCLCSHSVHGGLICGSSICVAARDTPPHQILLASAGSHLLGVSSTPSSHPPPLPLQDVMRNVITPMRHPDFFHSTLLRQKRGVLLYGPPGTGELHLVPHGMAGRLPAGLSGWGGALKVVFVRFCKQVIPSGMQDTNWVAGWENMHAQDRVRHVSPTSAPYCHGCRSADPAWPTPCLQARRCWPRRWPRSATPASSCSRAQPSSGERCSAWAGSMPHWAQGL